MQPICQNLRTISPTPEAHRGIRCILKQSETPFLPAVFRVDRVETQHTMPLVVSGCSDGGNLQGLSTRVSDLSNCLRVSSFL